MITVVAGAIVSGMIAPNRPMLIITTTTEVVLPRRRRRAMLPAIASRPPAITRRMPSAFTTRSLKRAVAMVASPSGVRIRAVVSGERSCTYWRY